MKEIQIEGKRYIACSCGSLESYISFSKEVCCYPCFKALEIAPPPPEVKVVLKETKDCFIAVKKQGEREDIIEYFHKQAEDYAYTSCRDFVIKENRRFEADHSNL